MNIFKQIRFWFVWALAAPLVFLFLVIAAIFTRQWKLITAKFGLIQLSLYQQFVNERAAKRFDALERQRINNRTKR
jgi:hypothetical protein